MGYTSFYKSVIEKLVREIHRYYGDNLFTIALFGSVAREKFNPESDIDILIVSTNLPKGRLSRIRDFIQHVETIIEEDYKRKGIKYIPEISPVIKTPEEVKAGSPLFLDMIEDVKIIYDKDGFFKSYLRELEKKLNKLGAKKVYKGGGWYWIIKPDYTPGEIIEL